MDTLLELSPSDQAALVNGTVKVLRGGALDHGDNEVCTLLQAINQNDSRINELNTSHILTPCLLRINSGYRLK